MNNNDDQYDICKKYGAPACPVSESDKVGISESALQKIYPLNGFRHHRSESISGWYIYGGEEISDDEDFFMPMHVVHLVDLWPDIGKYLNLAPGWRFLVAPGYEDVWFDPSLLEE